MVRIFLEFSLAREPIGDCDAIFPGFFFNSRNRLWFCDFPGISPEFSLSPGRLFSSGDTSRPLLSSGVLRMWCGFLHHDHNSGRDPSLPEPYWVVTWYQVGVKLPGVCFNIGRCFRALNLQHERACTAHRRSITLALIGGVGGGSEWHGAGWRGGGGGYPPRVLVACFSGFICSGKKGTVCDAVILRGKYRITRVILLLIVYK